MEQQRSGGDLRAAPAGEARPKRHELLALLRQSDPAELTGLLAHPERDVRSAALTALSAHGPAALPALDAVLPFLGDRRDRHPAAETVRAMGPDAVPALLAVRAHGPGRLRRHALHALAHLGAGGRLTDRDRAALERLVRIKLLDEPVPDDDWDLHWIAVPGAHYEAAFTALDLHDRIPATLAMGLSGRIHDRAGTDAHRIFVTPELAGWRLLFGSALVNSWYDGTLERLAEACGEAHFHYRDGYDDAHIWAIAERGRGIVRSFSTYGEPAWTGEPLPWEEPQTEDPDWEPDLYEPNASLENNSQAVAHRLSIDPEDIAADTPRRGHGWFALTAPGVGHGAFPGALEI